MAETFTARVTALVVTNALHKVGLDRKVDAKRVRAYVRDTMPAYDDGLYTAHLYSAATRDRIVAGMVRRYTAGRAASASLGRASKSATEASVKAQTRKTHKIGPKVEPTPKAPNGTPVRVITRDTAADA